MNSQKIKEFAVVVGAVVVGLFLYSLVERVTGAAVGGGVTNYGGSLTVEDFVANLTSTLTGAVTMSSTLAVTGATTLSSTLGLTGLATLDGGQLRSYTNSTSTTATTYTVVQADILNYDTMNLTLNTGDATFTLPATSTLTTMVPTSGDAQKLCIYNATTTAGIDLTLAAGTGIDLQSATSSLAINKGTIGCLTFTRQPDTDVTVVFDRYLDAD